MTNFSNALGLDIGDKRIGVARINAVARIPEPLVTLPNDEEFIASLKLLIRDYSIDLIVCGLPRNMSGLETMQTSQTREFVEHLKNVMPEMQFVLQDETLTTVDAQTLIGQGMKGDKDSVAAGYILADYVASGGVVHV